VTEWSCADRWAGDSTWWRSWSADKSESYWGGRAAASSLLLWLAWSVGLVTNHLHSIVTLWLLSALFKEFWHVTYRALAGPWKSWNNFSRFSRPGKSFKNGHGPWKSLNLCLNVRESVWIWFSKTRTRGKRIVFFFLPEAFCGVKHAENAIAAGAPLGPLLGELTTLPQTL